MTEEELLAEGWRRLPAVRYSGALGPVLAKRTGDRVIACLLAQEHLANDNLGVVHGGAIMTFADMALGLACGVANDGQGNFVTAQLSVQFTASANVGDAVTCEPEVIRKTSSLVFVRGLIVAGDRTVASADGIFKLLDPVKFGHLKAWKADG